MARKSCNRQKVLSIVAQAIKVRVEREAIRAVDFVGNDRHRAARLQEEAQMIRVVALVADQPFAGRCRGEQRRGAPDVGDVPAGQRQGQL